MSPTLFERAEMVIADAKSMGIWNDEDGVEFFNKVTNNEITPEFMSIIEKEIEVLKLILEEDMAVIDKKNLH